MKTVEIAIYKFSELPEEEQEKIISNWREDNSYVWGDENKASLNAFCKLFNVDVSSFSYGGGRDYINFNYENDDVEDMDYLRLHKWVINNYYDTLITNRVTYYSKDENGKYIKDCVSINSVKRKSNIYFSVNDCCFTGYYMDSVLIDPIIKFMKKPFDITMYDLINDCLQEWLFACRNDVEAWLSEETIKEEIEMNDYDFTIDGQIY